MAQHHVDQGFSFIRQHKHSFALSEFDAALKLDAGCEMAYFGKGESCRDQNKYEDAIKFYDAVLRINTKSIKALAFKACALKNIGRNDDAQKIYISLGTMVPQDAYDHLGLGLLYLASNRPMEAIAGYKNAIKLDPHFAFAHLLEGNAHSILGKHNDAIQSYTKAIKLDPKFATAHFNKGNTSFALKNFKEALHEYDTTLTITKGFALAHDQKGNVFSATGRIKEAMREYDNAIKCDVNLAIAYFHKANILAATKKTKEAIDYYDRATKADPNFFLAYFQNGNLHLSFSEKKSTEKALEYYDKVLKINPTFAPANIQKANILAILDRKEEAAECHKLLLSQLNAHMAFTSTGNTLAAAGQLQEALALYDEAIKIKPEFVDVYINKANVLALLKRFEDELECYVRAIQHISKEDPKLVWLYNNQGVAFLNLKRIEEAKLVLEKAMKLNAENVDVLNNLGNVYLALDNKEEALSYYDKALKIDPNFMNASMNKLLICLALERQNNVVPSKSDISDSTDSAYSETASQLAADVQSTSDMSISSDTRTSEAVNIQNVSSLVLAHQNNISHINEMLSVFITKVQESRDSTMDVVSTLLALLDGETNWPNEVGDAILDTLYKIITIEPNRVTDIITLIISKIKLEDAVESGYMSQMLCMMVKSDKSSIHIIEQAIEPLLIDENDIVLSSAAKVARAIKRIAIKDSEQAVDCETLTPPILEEAATSTTLDQDEASHAVAIKDLVDINRDIHPASLESEQLPLFTQGLNAWKILSDSQRIQKTVSFFQQGLERELDEFVRNDLLKYQAGIIAIRAGDMKLFKSIMDLSKIELNWTPTQYSQTLLYTIISSNALNTAPEYIDIVEKMLISGANPFINVNGITAFHAVVEQNNPILIGRFVQWNKDHADAINHTQEHQIVIGNEIIFDSSVERTIRDIIDIGYSRDQISSDNDQVIEFIGTLD